MGEARPVRTVGFVGLGNMGAPMAVRLVDAGFRVQAFDVSPSARARVCDAGAIEALSLEAVAQQADALILMLPDSSVVSSVLADPGLLGALSAGAIVVDMSSSEPLRTRELAEELAAHGIHLLDAPVSGGVVGAAQGTLTLMVGGSEFVLDRMAPVFVHLGRSIHAGSVGSGHAVKALNNLLSATHLWATSEVMEAGRRFGLDPQTMLEIFNASSGRSGSTENKWPKFILTQTYDSGFGLRLMLKDMRIAVSLAEQCGVPSELGADAVGLWSRAAADLPPEVDHTIVAKWIREKS